MSKSIKFNDNIFLDSKGIVHNKTLLSSILSDLLSKIDKSEIDSYSFNTNGYIRLTNGFQIAWVGKEAKIGGTAWGNVYYSDTSLGNWPKAFTTCFIAIPYTNSLLYWSAIGSAGPTSAGTIRNFRPNANTATTWVGAIGFGKWK